MEKRFADNDAQDHTHSTRRDGRCSDDAVRFPTAHDLAQRVGPAQDEPGLARFLVRDPRGGVPDSFSCLSAWARTPFLRQQVFEPEVIRALGIAYANACKSLNLIDRTDPQPNRLVRTVLARSIAPPQPIPVGYQLWERHATAGKTARSGASAPRRAGTNQSWRRLLASPLNQPII